VSVIGSEYSFRRQAVFTDGSLKPLGATVAATFGSTLGVAIGAIILYNLAHWLLTRHRKPVTSALAAQQTAPPLGHIEAGQVSYSVANPVNLVTPLLPQELQAGVQAPAVAPPAAASGPLLVRLVLNPLRTKESGAYTCASLGPSLAPDPLRAAFERPYSTAIARHGWPEQAAGRILRRLRSVVNQAASTVLDQRLAGADLLPPVPASERLGCFSLTALVMAMVTFLTFPYWLIFPLADKSPDYLYGLLVLLLLILAAMCTWWDPNVRADTRARYDAFPYIVCEARAVVESLGFPPSMLEADPAAATPGLTRCLGCNLNPVVTLRHEDLADAIFALASSIPEMPTLVAVSLGDDAGPYHGAWIAPDAAPVFPTPLDFGALKAGPMALWMRVQDGALHFAGGDHRCVGRGSKAAL
jgi:hypothetical protein